MVAIEVVCYGILPGMLNLSEAMTVEVSAWSAFGSETAWTANLGIEVMTVVT